MIEEKSKVRVNEESRTSGAHKFGSNGCPERIHQVQRIYGGRNVHKLLADASAGVKFRGEDSGKLFLVENFSSNCESTVIDIILRSADCQYYAIPRHILGMQSPNDPVHHRLHGGTVRGNRRNVQDGEGVGGDIHILRRPLAGDAVLDGNLHLLPEQQR